MTKENELFGMEVRVCPKCEKREYNDEALYIDKVGHCMECEAYKEGQRQINKESLRRAMNMNCW